MTGYLRPKSTTHYKIKDLQGSPLGAEQVVGISDPRKAGQALAGLKAIMTCQVQLNLKLVQV
jgi:hypothetical protein